MITVRNAEAKDADEILSLLRQILELHAALRPDIFISGRTKYTKDELIELLNDPKRYSYVAVDDNGKVEGYALCILRDQPNSNVMVPFDSMYIDDLCVNENARGKHIGTLLFDHVKKEARRLGCYELTLNVWQGNDSARAFYDKMGMTPKETMMELIL